MPVGSIDKFEAEHFGIVFRLLQSIGGELIGCFGLDHRQWEIAREVQEIIRALRRQALHLIALQRHDAPIGERLLLNYRMKLVIPTSRLEPRTHIRPTGFSLVHVL